MPLGLAVQEFIKATNWLLQVLREHKPLTEEEEQVIESKIRTLMLELDTWKRRKAERQNPNKPK
jgi:hypothetical protein